MKQGIILIAITILSLNNTYAQKFRSGIKGGFNSSTLYIDEVEERNIRPGFHAGFFGQMPVTDFIGVQSELLFTTAGNRSTYDIGPFDGEVDFNLNYIQLPVMANIKFMDLIELHAGPYVSFLVNSNISTEGDFGSSDGELDRDHFNTLDYGMALGAGVNIGDIQIGARYNQGFNEVADSDDARAFLGDARNVVGQLYIALAL